MKPTRSSPRPKRRPPTKNLVAIDGTLDNVVRVAIEIHEKVERGHPEDYHIHQRDAVREHIDCHNPYCHTGGFSLGDILRDMVRGRQTEYIGTCFCRGQEGDVEIPSTLHSCATRYDVEVTLSFRSSHKL